MITYGMEPNTSICRTERYLHGMDLSRCLTGNHQCRDSIDYGGVQFCVRKSDRPKDEEKPAVEPQTIYS